MLNFIINPSAGGKDRGGSCFGKFDGTVGNAFHGDGGLTHVDYRCVWQFAGGHRSVLWPEKKISVSEPTGACDVEHLCPCGGNRHCGLLECSRCS